MKYGFFFFISVLAFVACQENEISTFDNESSLFFFRDIYNNNSKGTPQLDSTSYSFFLAGSIQVDTVWLDVLLTGSPSDQDRPFRIVQSNVGEPGAAVAGTHYVAFDDPEMVKRMVIPANKVSVALPVIMTRTPQMDTEEYRLDMEILPNEYFIQGIKDRVVYVLKITGKATKPANWDSPNSYLATFGEWGQEKMRFIIDYVGYNTFDETLITDYRYYLQLKAREKLAEYEAVKGPILNILKIEDYETNNIFICHAAGYIFCSLRGGHRELQL